MEEVDKMYALKNKVSGYYVEQVIITSNGNVVLEYGKDNHIPTFTHEMCRVMIDMVKIGCAIRDLDLKMVSEPVYKELEIVEVR